MSTPPTIITLTDLIEDEHKRCTAALEAKIAGQEAIIERLRRENGRLRREIEAGAQDLDDALTGVYP